MKRITIGITAHVDSGKTTLAEAMLYNTGSTRSQGRVDNGSSCLDTDKIERDRGITIFAHQAEFSVDDCKITLLDTPGHIDFSAETERTMKVLDYAILVISASDGVQSHTSTLWKLLERYNVPVFIFVNKLDLPGADRAAAFENIRRRLSSDCADFSGTDSDIQENAASCSEELMDRYITAGELSCDEISKTIADRMIFPCCFGAALKNEGVGHFLKILSRFVREPERHSDFGASVYKVSYDTKGSRLTHMKITGGELHMREELSYTSSDGRSITGKISSLRFYSGEKFRTADTAYAGEVCAVTGLDGTYPGQGIGAFPDSEGAYLQPVMTYRAVIPDDKNIYDVMKDMRRLEDEDPQLHILRDEHHNIRLQLMGAVQLEVITELIRQKFGYSVTFEDGETAYRETIAAPVEGVGHYEPLRHYAEVHLLMKPLERGSGLLFDADCPEATLDRNRQRLILTHLGEKIHKGVLTGSPITDMKITLVAGKAHLKHTEGGDFRQATYRAVRQGLRSAESILLEPYYSFELEIPTENVGRAISDLQRMSAEFETPVKMGEMSVIRGNAPASELNGYHMEVISYTRGRGKLGFSLEGYRKCHNSDEIISKIGYDCDSDVENTGDSVFCSHGAGYVVKWNEVPEHMHLPAYLDRREEDAPDRERIRRFAEQAVSYEELMAIFERTYGKINRDPRRAFKKTKAVMIEDKNLKLPEYSGTDYLLVDGYNIIFAWEELKKIAEESLDAARAELLNMMCSFQGCTGNEIIVVFDAYKVKGKHREVEKYYNINVVYTQESETADSYIERVSRVLTGEHHRVRVATSDGPEQIIILGNGAMRISAPELHDRYKAAEAQIREYLETMRDIPQSRNLIKRKNF